MDVLRTRVVTAVDDSSNGESERNTELGSRRTTRYKKKKSDRIYLMVVERTTYHAYRQTSWLTTENKGRPARKIGRTQEQEIGGRRAPTFSASGVPRLFLGRPVPSALVRSNPSTCFKTPRNPITITVLCINFKYKPLSRQML